MEKTFLQDYSRFSRHIHLYTLTPPERINISTCSLFPRTIKEWNVQPEIIYPNSNFWNHKTDDPTYRLVGFYCGINWKCFPFFLLLPAPIWAHCISHFFDSTTHFMLYHCCMPSTTILLWHKCVTVLNKKFWSLDDLKWFHLDETTSEARWALSFVQRYLRTSKHNFKKIAYFAYIRPILEYACPPWDPIQKVHFRKKSRKQSVSTLL